MCVCLIDALILSHSGNGPWVGLLDGTQIFTMDTNAFVSTSMQAWPCKVQGECCPAVWYIALVLSSHWLVWLAPLSVNLTLDRLDDSLVCMDSSVISLNPKNSLFWWLDEAKIHPHAPHPRPDAGQELKHSGPILFKSEMFAFTHPVLFSFKCSMFPPVEHLCYFTHNRSDFSAVAYHISFMRGTSMGFCVHMGAGVPCMACLVNAS